ncbi:jg9893 [Pararge aegeria aegeria]|uniref:Jg9893 protein n=1 Tax=Pararge aegeria aegeria TaxID=348720 RepID=A0A8S4QS43_9NEOP|nr:jg9893 [Pararge aegeria aegeria]
MVTNLEWSDNLKGSRKTCMCSFHSGILIYGPDKLIRCLRKAENKWIVSWKYTPDDEVLRLVSNSTSDIAVVWTEKGFVYKLDGESEDKINVKLFTFKQRNIKKFQLIAPDYKYLATINNTGVVCIYEVDTAKLALVKLVRGGDISFEASPVDPLMIIFGEVGSNYGMAVFTFSPEKGLIKVENMCLTNQIVSKVVFSPTGKHVVAAAMSAGHIFIFHLTDAYKLNLIRYTELGRGLADCFLTKVGDSMRAFSLVLFSDKYAIGMYIRIGFKGNLNLKTEVPPPGGGPSLRGGSHLACVFKNLCLQLALQPVVQEIIAQI